MTKMMFLLLVSLTVTSCAPTYFHCSNAAASVCDDFLAGYAEADAQSACTGSLDGSFFTGSPCDSAGYAIGEQRVGRCTTHFSGAVLRRSYYSGAYSTESARALCPPATPIPSVDYEFEER